MIYKLQLSINWPLRTTDHWTLALESLQTESGYDDSYKGKKHFCLLLELDTRSIETDLMA